MTRREAQDHRGPAIDDRSTIRSADEITSPPTDPVRYATDHDVDDPADVPIDPEVWRQGGPTRTPGAVTTTSGADGPVTKHAAGRKNEGKTAPTTTGDATSGGMRTPSGAATRDASSSGTPTGGVAENDEDER